MKKFAFLKKELNEIAKTNKKIVLPAVFLLFGFLSPLSAKYVNELLKNIEGITRQLPEPTYFDSYTQFFKNVVQMGVIVLILVFMGTVVEEKVKGSAILVLTKPVSRAQFIISKFAASLVLFTLSYLLGVLGFVYYNYLLFPNFSLSYLFTAMSSLWLFCVLILSITIFASTVSKSQALAAVIGFAGYILISIIDIIPYVDKYSPGALGNMGINIVKGTQPVGDLLIPSMVTVAGIILFIILSIATLKRQEI